MRVGRIRDSAGARHPLPARGLRSRRESGAPRGSLIAAELRESSGDFRGPLPFPRGVHAGTGI
jgi:hypothetical protein